MQPVPRRPGCRAPSSGVRRPRGQQQHTVSSSLPSKGFTVPLTTVAEQRARIDPWAYVQIARVDHWFKNSFMVLGVILAVFYEPGVLSWSSVSALLVGVAATCL